MRCHLRWCEYGGEICVSLREHACVVEGAFVKRFGGGEGTFGIGSLHCRFMPSSLAQFNCVTGFGVFISPKAPGFGAILEELPGGLQFGFSMNFDGG